jgi:hypothetical protein
MKLWHRFVPLPPERRPQDPSGTGKGLRFVTLDYGGEYPDNMPQAINLIDAEGRSCIYVPVHVEGKVVDSHGFNLEVEGEEFAPGEGIRRQSQ